MSFTERDNETEIQPGALTHGLPAGERREEHQAAARLSKEMIVFLLRSVTHKHGCFEDMITPKSWQTY